MMHILYVLLTYMLAPVVIAMEGWNALRNPEYRGRLSQRLGFVAPQAAPGCRVHAVSVGEVQAAAGLISALRDRFPDLQVVICTAYSEYSQDAMLQRFGDSDNFVVLKKRV